MAHRASESIESPDKQHVAAMKLVETSIEPGAFTNCSGCRVSEDQVFGNTVLLQSIALEIKFLAARADTGIPDQTSVWSGWDRSRTSCQTRLRVTIGKTANVGGGFAASEKLCPACPATQWFVRILNTPKR